MLKTPLVRQTLHGIFTVTVMVILCGCSQDVDIEANASTHPLISAAFNGDLAYVKESVQKDPNILNAADDRGRSLLHYAAEGGHADLVAFLLESGADPNFEDNDGYYPLDAAVQGGAPKDVVDMLKEAAAGY